MTIGLSDYKGQRCVTHNRCQLKKAKGTRHMEQVKNVIVDYLKANSFMDRETQLGDNDSLTQQGIIDSIGLLELMDYISDKYSIEIPEDMLTPENFDSLQGITNMVTKLVK
jgi:acyl carrier protein